LVVIELLWYEHGYEQSGWSDDLAGVESTVAPLLPMVGFLRKETKSHYYVSPSICPQGDHAGVWAVAKGACAAVRKRPWKVPR
jgi:hypothetical protein